MKNRKTAFILSFLLVLGFIPLVTSDPSFEVTKPARNQVFIVGDNVISWDPPINVSHMRIDLYIGFNHLKALDIWVDNTGEFTWTLNETDTYKHRSDYKIKVSSAIIPDIYGWSEEFCINLYSIDPVDPVDPDPIDIDTFAVIVIAILLTIVILMYYNKKTHKIQNWIKKIRSKLNNKDTKIKICPYCNEKIYYKEEEIDYIKGKGRGVLCDLCGSFIEIPKQVNRNG